MIEWMMMGAFILGLALSVWKLYAFFPTKPLADDDTTPESVALLERIMVESNAPEMELETLYETMQRHRDFDAARFWRFNPNRLHHLIERYRFKDPDFRR